MTKPELIAALKDEKNLNSNFFSENEKMILDNWDAVMRTTDQAGLHEKMDRAWQHFKRPQDDFLYDDIQTEPEKPEAKPPDESQAQAAEDAFLLQFCRFNKDFKPIDTVDNRIVEYVIEHCDIFVLFGQPYVYINGVFRLDENGIRTQAIIKNLIVPDLRTDNRITRAYKLLLKDIRIQISLEDLNNYPQNWINCENGMVDCLTDEIYPHSPKYRSVNQFPHNYVKGLDFSKSVFAEFLKSRIPDKENLEMLCQFGGTCLLSPLIFPKFLMLIGQGNSGKSLILWMLKIIFGQENMSALPLQGLSDRFSSAYLLNKQINVCADIDTDAPLRDLSVIKQATGGDLVRGEYKGGAIFFFENRAKMVFSANDMPPVINERSNGFWRRLLVIRFANEGEYIPNLKERLVDEREIETVLSWFVSGAKLALKQGRIFESRESLREVSRLQAEADSVAAFIAEATEQGENLRVKRGQLFSSYEKFCEDEKRQPLGKVAFFKALRAKSYREIKTNGEYYICGLRLGFMKMPEQEENPFEQL